MNSNLGKNAILYTLTTISVKAVSFLLLPFYTHLIKPEEYGLISLFQIISSLLTVLFSITIHSSISRFFYDCKTEEEKKTLFSSIAFYSLVSSFALYIILFSVLKLFIKTDIYKSEYIILLLITSFINILINNNMTLLKIAEKAKQVSIATIVVSIFSIIINFILITSIIDKVFAYMLSGAVAAFLSFSVSLYYVKNYFTIKLISFKKIIPAIKYSFFRLPVDLSAFVVTFADRFMLFNMKSSFDTGLYSVGYKVGSALGMVSGSVNSAFVPHSFKLLSNYNDENAEKLRKDSVRILLVYSSFCFFMNLLLPELYLILNKDYYSSIYVSSIIIFTYYIDCLRYVFQVGMDYKIKYVKYKSMLWFSAAIVNIIFNFILIPSMGIYGASIATLLSNLVILPFIIYLSLKAYPLRHNKSIFLIIGGTFLPVICFFIKPSLITFIIKLALVLTVLYITARKNKRFLLALIKNKKELN